MEEGMRENSMGFAAYYVDQFEDAQEDEIDIQIYAKLVEVDSRLGVSAADQLFKCLSITTCWDIIKVLFKYFEY